MFELGRRVFILISAEQRTITVAPARYNPDFTASSRPHSRANYSCETPAARSDKTPEVPEIHGNRQRRHGLYHPGMPPASVVLPTLRAFITSRLQVAGDNAKITITGTNNSGGPVSVAARPLRRSASEDLDDAFLARRPGP